MEHGGVDGLEGAGAGAHLTGVVLGSLGDDGAVGDNDDGPFELGLEVLDDGSTRPLTEQELTEFEEKHPDHCESAARIPSHDARRPSRTPPVAP